MQFRKKPVVIDAWPVRDIVRAAQTEGSDIPEEIEKHLASGAMRLAAFWAVDGVGMQIATLEGTMDAMPDDWLIRGVKGEFYPCKPEIFAATYDAVEG